MKAHTCYHCKQWVEDGEAHDCWTTTEDALTRDLPEDVRDAWERLRDVLGEHGEQRIYASHNSIMFARKACYAFVRPSARRLELCFFLGRTVSSPIVKRAQASSRVKVAHTVHLLHRDQVEEPLTDWLREAYDVSDELTMRRIPPGAPASSKSARSTSSPGSEWVTKARPASTAKGASAAQAKRAFTAKKPSAARTKARSNARTKPAAAKRPAPPARRRTARAKAR